MSARDQLVAATKALLWERGYDAMSPGDVLKASGVGQGSLYHHFSGKADLAATALREVAADMMAEAESLLRSDKPPLERVRDYLRKPRIALLGCRIGRLAYDAEVPGNETLRDPMAWYFDSLEGALTAVLDQARADGTLRIHLDTRDLAASLVALVQGGYVLTRATCDPVRMERTMRGALALLEPS